MVTPARLALAQAQWGLYWLRLALYNPDRPGVYQHNAHMNAMMCLALEALA